MDKFIISGQKKICGEVKINGSKNAVLPILVASLLTEGESIIKNVPDLVDVRTMCLVLENLGAKIKKEGYTLIINSQNIFSHTVPYELMNKMRASVITLGSLLARFKKAEVSFPGGCALGPRPVNIHLDGFKALGAKISIEEGYIKVEGKLKGGNIYLDYPSVGATENLLIGATLAEGRTIIKNAAQEPEIEDLVNFLVKMGAKIKGVGTDTIYIEGVKKLIPTEYTIMPDRIEAITFIIATLITKGEVNICGVLPQHLTAVLDKLSQAGANFSIKNNHIYVKNTKKIKALEIETLPYPGFPTDSQPLIMALLTIAEGTSIITETVFKNRFTQAVELNRLGANITVKGDTAIIKGVLQLKAARVMASDIRGGMALVLAGLIANGKSEVLRVYHIDRGYEKIEKRLADLGADITRIK